MALIWLVNLSTRVPRIGIRRRGHSLVDSVLQADRKRQADMKKAQLAKEAQLEEGEYEAAVRSDELTTLVLPR